MTLFYLDGVKAKDLSAMHDINIRTFFRRKNIALNKFSNAMLSMGFHSNYLLNLLNEEKWILRIYENNLKNFGGKEESEDNYSLILKRTISELKSFSKKTCVSY